MSPDPPTPQLRASDADREAAVERLQRAAVEGRLDHEELDERLAAAYAARWTGDLDRLTADIVPAPPRYPAPSPYPAPGYPMPYAPAKQTNGLAVASLVASLVWFFWLGSIAAVVFGHVALSQIKKSNGTQSGEGMAIAGLVVGYLSLLFIVAAVLASA